MNTCGTCKHFGEPVDAMRDWETGDDDPPPSDYHECLLLKHLNKTRPLETSLPAGVVDGSGYYAAFCVKEEFGCNQWAARAAPPQTDESEAHHS